MLTYLRLTLHPDEILIADLASAAQLHCEQGSVWLASNRNAADLILNAGEHQRLAPGLLLLEGQAELRFSGHELNIRPQFKTIARPTRAV
ncbi:DUF2917 domain-containing protein [Chitinibacter sp. S2-10]|uniref:DUF2917 domain-containing protein n=1 Tax=Chitinibacter sp. S2-10 TaxID=3373597 RepID=UPI0039776807